MSGPRDTRESAEEAGTSAVPAGSAPPEPGGAVPPAEAPPPADEASPAAQAGPAAPVSPRLAAFGLQAPWWAAESTETAPPPEDTPPAPPSAETAGEPADEDTAPGTGPPARDPAGSQPAGPGPPGPPAGTLVAGVGVPNIDSRGAVPAEPLVKREPASGDTDPDGFPAVRPEAGPPAGLPETPAPGRPAPDKTEDDTAVDNTAVESAADDRSAGGAPAAPGETAYAAQTAAFERARAAEDASTATLGQVLEPDAILPVGVTPPTGSGTFPSTEAPQEIEGAAPTAEQAAVIEPVYHAEGGVPIDTPPPPGQPPQQPPQGPTPPAPPAAPRSAPESGGSGKRRPLLIGGAAAVILAAGVALFAVGGGGTESDSAPQSGKVQAPETPAAPESALPPTTPPPTPSGPPSRIDNERTDPKPIAFKEVFPTEAIKLGGRTFTRDRWSLNRDPSYAARGSMLQALRQQKCRKIVRATFIHRGSSLAVTSGIAVMPTKAAALKISQAGDPAKYEWFRGMGGKHTPNLDRAGGYAATTVRGRYVAYAYVQWANGKQAQPGDPVIKQAARHFLDYDLRAIKARAKN